LGTSITEQPEVQVELSTLIGESLMALGDIAAAEPVLNRASTEARQVLGEHHDLTIRVALLQAQIHRMRGRAKEARAELDRILPMLRADTATKPLDLATALAHRTLIAIEETEYVDAERFAIEGDLLATAKLGYENEQTITSSILLALAYRYTKKFEQSRDAGQKAYHSALARFGESVPHPRVIEAKTAYARALADNGELAAGIALIDTAVADLRTLIGPDSFQVGITLQNLVAYRIDLGELALANSNGAEALKIVTANSQTESVTYAATLSARAQAHLAQRDGSALDEFNRAIPILTRLIGPEREATRLARTGKALSLAYLGRLEAAQEEIDSLMMNSKRKDGVASPMEPAAARAAQVRGTISRLRGDYATALQWQQPIADLENVGPKLQRERMRALAEVGLIRLEQGDATASATMFEQALKEFQRLESSITPAHVDALIGLGRARLAQGRSVEARPLLESADAFWRELDSESRWAGEAALWLGRCYQALGRSVEARDAIRRAEKIQRRSLLPADLMKPASTQSP
jgi:tetratricopeptide (TPR) repeat protein